MKLRSFLFLLFVMALNVSVAFGQNSTAIKGIVTDPNGAVVAGATVTLAEQAGTNRRTSVTDAAGAFSFDGLPTGNYRLTVEKTGFAVLTQNVTSSAGELNLKLQVSGVGASVNVEGETYVAKESVTATKTDTPLMETPFTVQVMPQQVIVDVGQQQDIGKAASLLGIPTQGFDNYSSTFFYRGFLSSGTLWNGFRIDEITTTAGPGNGPVWMDNVERLELLRGPASILYGQLETGGALNVVTKKPRNEFHGEVRAGVGSWANRWGSIDLSSPLNKSKTLYGRVIASVQRADSFFTYSPDYKSSGVVPQIAWRILPRTTISFEGQYRNVDTESWQRSYAFAQPVTGALFSVPLKDSRLPDNAGRFEQRRSLIGVDHSFNEDWSVSWKFLDDRTNNPYTFFQSARATNFATQAPGVLNSTLVLTLNGTDLKTRASMLDVRGHFSTGNMRHTLLAGGDYYDNDFLNFTGFTVGLTTNIFNPTRRRDDVIRTRNYRDRLRKSLYVQDQVAIAKNWHFLAGMRFDSIKEDYAIFPVTGTPTLARRYEKNVVTPRVGLLWRPLELISLYYSYSQNQGQSQGAEYPGVPLKPEFSEQHEAGVKTALLGGRVGATASLFQIVKKNIASADLDPTHAGFVIGIGEVRSRGFELNLQGALTDRWSVTANYSYARPIIVVGASGANVGGSSGFGGIAGQLLPQIPKHNFSAWTSYDVPRLRGLTVGGGPTWRSKATVDPTSFNVVTRAPISADASWRTSAFARYETRIAGLNTQFQLNADNLFNTLYSNLSYCSGGLGATRNDCYFFYGNPRSAQLQMRVRF